MDRARAGPLAVVATSGRRRGVRGRSGERGGRRCARAEGVREGLLHGLDVEMAERQVESMHQSCRCCENEDAAGVSVALSRPRGARDVEVPGIGVGKLGMCRVRVGQNHGAHQARNEARHRCRRGRPDRAGCIASMTARRVAGGQRPMISSPDGRAELGGRSPAR